MQRHTKRAGNLIAQVDQAPAHHLVALRIRALTHPRRYLLFRLGRELVRRRTQIGTVPQPLQAIFIVAVPLR